MSSPTQLTLKRLRDWGYTADVVEQWVSFHGREDGDGPTGVRRDLFGIGDVMACKADEGILLVQCTSANNAGARLKKVQGTKEILAWLRAGGKFEVWGWFKKSGKWNVNRFEVLEDGIDPREVEPARKRNKKSKQPTLFA